MDVLTKEERNDIKLFKCRSVGESFNEDDWRGRDALVRGLATAEAQLTARDAEIKRLTQERDTLAARIERAREIVEKMPGQSGYSPKLALQELFGWKP